MGFRLLFIGLLLGAASPASQVTGVHSSHLYVAVSQDKDAPFEQDDRLCITQNAMDIACGDVMEVRQNQAIISLDFQKESFSSKKKNTPSEKIIELTFHYPVPHKGDGVRLVSKNPKRTIRQLTSELVASNRFAGEIISEVREEELEEAIRRLEASKPFKPISVLSLGMTWLFPTMQYQQAMSPRWGAGLSALYLNQNVGETGNLKGPGLFVTYNHYHGGPLNGVWWQIGAGGYHLEAAYQGNVGKSYQPALSALVGWRCSWKNKVNLGLGGGGQFLPAANNAAQTGISFNGFLPSAAMDVGIIF